VFISSGEYITEVKSQNNVSDVDIGKRVDMNMSAILRNTLR